ncbi:MAG: hypothetical protein IPL33_17960 [Sphingobacteriales bacterium]|nr:hypothetical protein [Sphingobacteriales bacterium]
MATSNKDINTAAQSIVLGKLEQQAVMRRAQDIETWRRALRIAETIGNQNRIPIYGGIALLNCSQTEAK